jgi:hypothetical protein
LKTVQLRASGNATFFMTITCSTPTSYDANIDMIALGSVITPMPELNITPVLDKMGARGGAVG